MVIFQVINNIALDRKGGGAEAFAVRLTNELNKTFDCHLIVVWRLGTPEEQRVIDSLKEKVHIHFLSESKNLPILKFFFLCRKFYSLVKQYSPDIINSHSALPDLINSTVLVQRNWKERSIVRTMHTDRNWTNNRILENLFINCVFPLIFNSEVSISKATKRRLDARTISKITKKFSPIIYNGIPDNVNKYKKNEREIRRDNASVVRIVSVGRLTEQKGFSYLLTAMSILEEKEQVKLIIVGEGPMRGELQGHARLLGLGERVEFLGYRTDVLEILSTADIFISSSLWEGFPTVILEAMAIGIPVIATDISGSNELIINGTTGILVPIENPVEIAKAISLFISNASLTKQVVSNAQNIVYQYSMDAVTEEYSRLYQKLVSSKK